MFLHININRYHTLKFSNCSPFVRKPLRPSPVKFSAVAGKSSMHFKWVYLRRRCLPVSRLPIPQSHYWLMEPRIAGFPCLQCVSL